MNNGQTNGIAILRDSIDLRAPMSYTRLVLDGGMDFMYRASREKLMTFVEQVHA
jgi:hypothetical protein